MVGQVSAVDVNLTEKIAVVTGASKGIGLAISQTLAAGGAHVIAGARHNSAELKALETAGSATFIAADLSTAEGPRALIAAAAERGGIDILVNNTGSVTPHFDGLVSVSDDDWLASVALNFLSAVRTTREAIPHLLTRVSMCYPDPEFACNQLDVPREPLESNFVFKDS